MNQPIVSPKWLYEHLDHPDLIILDASLAANKSKLDSEFANVQIKGSRFFDLKNTFRDKKNALPNTLPDPQLFARACRELGICTRSKIVVYDHLGIYSSPRVWWMFKTMGHRDVAVLDGGLPAWVNEGFEVETRQDQAVKTGDFSANYQAELVANMDRVVSNLQHKSAVVIDARSAERFKGTAPEPRKGLESGHIPGAKNIPFKDVLNEGKYKPKAELRAIFESLKLDNHPLIFTCGSGITACIIMLASELIQKNPCAVYDGSWTEWAQTEALPIEKET